MLLQDRDILENEEYSEGQNIFVEGHPCSCAYIIVQGKVQISFQKGNMDYIVRVAQKGDLMAEMDWMNNQAHIFSAKVLEKTICIKVPNLQLIKNYLKSPVPIQGILRNNLNLLLGIKGVSDIITAADIQRIVAYYMNNSPSESTLSSSAKSEAFEIFTDE